MHRYDMAPLGLTARFFVTRQKGEVAYAALSAALHDVHENDALVLVFPSSQLMDASYADEAVVRLGEDLGAGMYGDRGLLLTGLTDDSLHNLNAVIHLRRLKLALLTIGPAGTIAVVGQLEPSLREVLDMVSQQGQMTASHLAVMLDLALNAASTRLKRLYDQRVIRREYEVSKKGLEYIYSPWLSSVNMPSKEPRNHGDDVARNLLAEGC